MMLMYALAMNECSNTITIQCDISQILKLDVSNGAVKRWSKSDCSPSEPVFVPHPEAQKEDDGKIVLV